MASSGESEPDPMQHTLAWLIWTLSAASLALLVRNPLYLTLLALSAWLVYLTVGEEASTSQSWRGLLKLGLFIWALTIPFNALMIHQGRFVLFSLPVDWPLVGGAITLEALLYGLVTGFSLWILLLIFAGFNVAVDASELLRVMPAFFYQAGTVASIALTFLPQMIASAQEIREAQRLRGHRFRGLRDLLPLFVPLLTTAMERAIELAESMEARGFGGVVNGLNASSMLRQRLRLLAGLGLVLSGMVARAFWSQLPWIGTVLIALGVLLLIYALQALSQQTLRSRYTRRQWRASDTLIVASGLLALAGCLFLRILEPRVLVYYPYPPYPIWPSFDARIGVLISLLTVPALVNVASWRAVTAPDKREP